MPPCKGCLPLIQFLSVSNGFPSFLLFLSLTKNPNLNPNPTVGSFKIYTPLLSVCLRLIKGERHKEFKLDRNPARSFPKSIYFDVAAQFASLAEGNLPDQGMGCEGSCDCL